MAFEVDKAVGARLNYNPIIYANPVCPMTSFEFIPVTFLQPPRGKIFGERQLHTDLEKTKVFFIPDLAEKFFNEKYP